MNRIFPKECDLIIAYLRKHVKRPVKPYMVDNIFHKYGWRRRVFLGVTCCPMGLLPEANRGKFIAGVKRKQGGALYNSAIAFFPIWDFRCAKSQELSIAAWREIWPDKENTE